MPDEQPTTLGEAVERYLETHPATDAAPRRVQLRKFVEFLGPNVRFDTLLPWQVAGYAESLDINTSNVALKIDPVKEFLRYARKKDWHGENLANHIKARGGRRRSDNGGRPELARIALTAEGLASMQAELAELKSRVPQMAEAIRLARADGDLRENQPYHAAREEKAKVDARIRQLEATISLADVIDGSEPISDRVRIGRTVKVHDVEFDETFTWTLVNPSEVDARAGKISIESPAGRALLDRITGDHVDVDAPAGIQRYRILEIVA